MTGYTVINEKTVSRNSDGAIVINEPTNADWPEYIAWLAQGNAADQRKTILSQELMAQFTVEDYGHIKNAIAGNDAFGLLWVSLQTQKDAMNVQSTRFRAGWNALIEALGGPRMQEIGVALGVDPLSGS